MDSLKAELESEILEFPNPCHVQIPQKEQSILDAGMAQNFFNLFYPDLRSLSLFVSRTGRQDKSSRFSDNRS